jgi:hypothetical protein
MASSKGENNKARRGKKYVKPALTKHGSLNSQVASFRTFY